jgi:hypothetical protein
MDARVVFDLHLPEEGIRFVDKIGRRVVIGPFRRRFRDQIVIFYRLIKLTLS